MLRPALPICAALGLAACGGGGGGGSVGVASIPIPTQNQTPAVRDIGAPAAATTGAAPASPLAVAGGPTIAAPGSTVFPLLESVWTRTSNVEAADPTTMDAGATLSINSAAGQVMLNVANSAAGVSNATLSGNRPDPHFYTASAGTNTVNLNLDSSLSGGSLSWTSYGNWWVYGTAINPATTGREGFFVVGYRTPPASVPISGTATYVGKVTGEVVFPGTAGDNGINNLTGDSSLQANFGTGQISGALTNMVSSGWEGPPQPWNHVSILGSFGIGQNAFAGTTAVGTIPSNEVAMSGIAVGTIRGAFFGPSANELGAVWTLFDGVKAAMGTIGAAATGAPAPGAGGGGGAGYWDY
jgi:hypothetical protein